MSAGENAQNVRYIVAGMLSTIDFIPAQSHPEEMLSLADKIIHHINIASGIIPHGSPDGPYEVREEDSSRDVRARR